MEAEATTLPTSDYHEYDVYLPMFDNKGKRTPQLMVNNIKQSLTTAFGGVTDFHHKAIGTWKIGSTTFHDEILILRVISESQKHAHRVLTSLKQNLKNLLEQEDVLIVERRIKKL